MRSKDLSTPNAMFHEPLFCLSFLSAIDDSWRNEFEIRAKYLGALLGGLVSFSLFQSTERG
jgi:hypothetical protein